MNLFDRGFIAILTRPVTQFVPVGLQMLHLFLNKQFVDDLVKHLQVVALVFQLKRLLLDLFQSHLIIALFSADDHLLQEKSKLTVIFDFFQIL